jgi:hypothetical protein
MRSRGSRNMKPIHTKKWLGSRREEALTWLQGSKLAFHFSPTQLSSVGPCQMLSFVHRKYNLSSFEYEFWGNDLASIMSRPWGWFCGLDQSCTNIIYACHRPRSALIPHVKWPLIVKRRLDTKFCFWKYSFITIFVNLRLSLVSN